MNAPDGIEISAVAENRELAPLGTSGSATGSSAGHGHVSRFDESRLDDSRSDVSRFDVNQALERHGGGGVAGRGLNLVRGVGARVEDDRGRIYIDCIGGQGSASLGHAHPALTAAISRQARQLISAPALYGHEKRARLLERLARVTGYSRFFLVNSGAEAVEASLKYARITTGRSRIVACRRGFHGRTLGALSATWQKSYRQPFAPLVPDVEHVPFGDLVALEEVMGEDVAAFLLEPVQGEGGVHPAPPGYLEAARRLCDRHGALLVLDEVQTGLGRTGRWLAQNHWLEPGSRADVVALAKGLGGGVPIGAMALRQGLEPFPKGSHGSTFGGNPLACAAACATLAVMEREDLPARADRLGRWALTFLSDSLGSDSLGSDSPRRVQRVREVRGLGLMVAIELRERVGPWLRHLQEEERILALPAGRSILRLLPPLTIAEEDWRDVIVRLSELLAGDSPATPRGRR